MTDTTLNHFQLGNKLYREGKFDEAIAAYNTYIKSNPGFAWAHYNLGEAYVRQGRSAKAKEAHQFAVSLQPNSILFKQALKAVLLTKLSTNLGNLTYEDYLKIGDDYRFRKEFENSILHYMQAIGTKSNSYAAHIRIESLINYSNLDDNLLKKLEVFYFEFIKTYTNFPLAYSILGNLLSIQNRYQIVSQIFKSGNYFNLLRNKPGLVQNINEISSQSRPKFLIIGTTKSGTSSLYSYINQHPNVLPAIQKEIKYFSDYGKEKDQSLDWYLAHFPSLINTSLYYSGEATPFYFYQSYAASRIKKNFPEIKLILIFRDPVARAISQYYHWVRLGVENRPIEDAFKVELDLLSELNDNEVTDISSLNSQFNKPEYRGKYIYHGMYSIFIGNWISLFGKNNILILKSEDLKHNPSKVMNKVFSFLDLPNFSGEYSTNLNTGIYPEVDVTIHNRISNFFEPFNAKLEAHTGMKFNW
jgi:tetratricopeptide (TPR) repeat protein